MTWIITALLLLSWPALGHLFWLLLAVAAAPHPSFSQAGRRPFHRPAWCIMADDDRMASAWVLCILSGPLASAAVPFVFWLFRGDE